MKQVDKVSIGGYAFTMESEAAQAARIYLEQLGDYYKSSEVMEGIEERMAELLLEKTPSEGVVDLATVNGITVGLVGAEGEIDGKSAAKAARFVRFCDAFSIPVATFLDADKFCCIKSAAKLTSAYAEATTAKITFITGNAFGSVYIALAGTGAAADLTFAWENASVSALSPEAETVIMLGDDFGGQLKNTSNPTAERQRIIENYKKENLTAVKAAEQGYVEDIISPDNTRNKLIAALAMLGNKRVSTPPKKHNNIYI